MTDEELLALRLMADEVIHPSQILPHVRMISNGMSYGRDVYGRLSHRRYKVQTNCSLYIIGYETFLKKDSKLILIQAYDLKADGYVVTDIEFSWTMD